MRKFLFTLFCAFSLLPAARADTNPVTMQLARFRAEFPDIHLLVVSGDQPREREVHRIDAFLRANDIPQDVVENDDELANVVDYPHGKDPMEPINWVLDNDPQHTVCLMTLDRRDYRHAGSEYWRESWDVTDPHLKMQLNPVWVGNWNVDHEMYHCLAPHLELEHDDDAISSVLDTLYQESSADVFAALLHLQATGDRSLIRATAAMREMFVTEDTTHYTSIALRYVVVHPTVYNARTLHHRSLRDLAFLAHRIVKVNWPQMARRVTEMKHDPQASRELNRQGLRLFEKLGHEPD